MVASPENLWALGPGLLVERKRMVVMGGAEVAGGGRKSQLQVVKLAGNWKMSSKSSILHRFNAFLAKNFTKPTHITLSTSFSMEQRLKIIEEKKVGKVFSIF